MKQEEGGGIDLMVDRIKRLRVSQFATHESMQHEAYQRTLRHSHLGARWVEKALSFDALKYNPETIDVSGDPLLVQSRHIKVARIRCEQLRKMYTRLDQVQVRLMLMGVDSWEHSS